MNLRPCSIGRTKNEKLKCCSMSCRVKYSDNTGRSGQTITWFWFFFFFNLRKLKKKLCYSKVIVLITKIKETVIMFILSIL